MPKTNMKKIKGRYQTLEHQVFLLNIKEVNRLENRLIQVNRSSSIHSEMELDTENKRFNKVVQTPDV